MTRINATPPPFTIAVGDLDITSLVTQYSLRQASVTVPVPIFLTGTIAIARADGWTGESLDDYVNPCRWVRGKQTVTLSIASTLFATLRINNYVYDEDTETAEIEVTQLLDLLSYKTPPEDYRFISNSPFNTPISTIISSLISKSGLTDFDGSGYTENAAIPAPDRTNRGYIELAQEILGERGFWLHHAPNEQVRIKQLNLAAAPSFSRSREELIEWSRQSPNEITPTLYRVTGGGDKFQSSCSLGSAINRTEEILGDSKSQTGYWYNGVYVPTRTTFGRQIIEKIVTELVTDQTDLIVTKKTGYKDLKLVSDTGKEYEYFLRKTYEIFDSQYYDSQGRLTKQITRKDGIAFGNYPETKYDLYPSALQWISALEETEVVYSHDPRSDATYDGAYLSTFYDTNVLRLRVETINKKYLNIATTFGVTTYNFLIAPAEKTVETWVEKCPNIDESTFLYRRRFFSRDPSYNYVSKVPALVRTTELFLINSLSTDETNSNPPSWTIRDPLYPRVSAKLFAEVQRRYLCSDQDLIDLRESEYQAKSIITDGDAQRLANMLADLSIGRSQSYEIVMALGEATEFIADPTPLQVAWIHNREFLLDSLSLVFDGKEAEASWEAATLRTIEPPIS